MFAADPAQFDSAEIIDEALKTVREHFGMPVAYLSRIEGGQTIYRNVSAPGLEHLIKPGDTRAMQEVYCPHILAGTLPNLIPDTANEPICQGLPITEAVPIGSHVSVPIKLAGGEVYGMFCCLSPQPNPTLNERDLAIMQNFAGLVARQVKLEEETRNAFCAQRKWAEEILQRQSFRPVFQPLVRLKDRSIAGVEALSRFDDQSDLGTEEIFLRMANAGLGLEIELATLSRAIEDAKALPPDIYLSLNASPDLICDPRFRQLLRKSCANQIVIEVTEHVLGDDEARLQKRLAKLRSEGCLIAIDDVGAGHSGLQRVASTEADILKIDRSIVSGVDKSPAQRAIVAALVHYATETDASVLVEGIETENEANTMLSLGVSLAQGWLFGHPAPIRQLRFG